MDRFSYQGATDDPLRQRLIEDMQLRNFSAHTIEAYVRAVAYVSKRYGRSPDQLSVAGWALPTSSRAADTWWAEPTLQFRMVAPLHCGQNLGVVAVLGSVDEV